MITEVKKPLIRKLTLRVSKDQSRSVVFYVQPDGLMAFRFSGCRKRYWIPMDRVLALAVANGPIDGLMEIMLAEKVKQQRGKRGKEKIPAPATHAE